jgi:protein TonB
VSFSDDILEPRRVRAARWAGAAVFVVVAHAACTALAIMHWPAAEEDDATAGATWVEMVAAPVAAMDSPDVAVGPRAQDALPAPPPQEQVKEVAHTEQPKFEEAPLAPEPEVAMPVARPIEEEAPKEEERERAKKRIEATEADAQMAMAPPKVEPAEEPQTKPAASAGASAKVRLAQASWEKRLISHLNRFKRYPEAARARGDQGSALVAFSIDRTGKVLSAHVLRTAGSHILDEEAISVLQRASPLPAPPPEVAGEIFPLTVPVQFHIK